MNENEKNVQEPIPEMCCPKKSPGENAIPERSESEKITELEKRISILEIWLKTTITERDIAAKTSQKTLETLRELTNRLSNLTDGMKEVISEMKDLYSYNTMYDAMKDI